MREYLFRGKRVDNGEWVEGYFYEECGATYIIEDRQKETMLNRNTPYKVLPETVGQFTGLKDKNGVKVFDGDKIKLEKFEYYIAFENGAFYAYHTRLKDCMGCPYRWGLASRFEELGLEFEIIGNIHDNPELTNK